MVWLEKITQRGPGLTPPTFGAKAKHHEAHFAHFLQAEKRALREAPSGQSTMLLAVEPGKVSTDA
jgi:hypothetical protein